MPSIDVCYALSLIERFDLKEKAVVVIDILRATSNINAALAKGAKKVITVAEVEEFEKYDAATHLFAAERNGEKLEGYKYGNSPQQWDDENALDKNIVLTTTNGTRCVRASQGAAHIIAGAFTNLNAIADHLIELDRDVILFCAGWKGRGSIEDLCFAGALAEELKADFETAYDSVAIAHETYHNRKEDLLQAFKETHYYQRVSKESLGDDLQFCISMDLYDFVATFDGDGFVKNGLNA